MPLWLFDLLRYDHLDRATRRRLVARARRHPELLGLVAALTGRRQRRQSAALPLPVLAYYAATQHLRRPPGLLAPLFRHIRRRLTADPALRARYDQVRRRLDSLA